MTASSPIGAGTRSEPGLLSGARFWIRERDPDPAEPSLDAVMVRDEILVPVDLVNFGQWVATSSAGTAHHRHGTEFHALLKVWHGGFAIPIH